MTEIAENTAALNRLAMSIERAGSLGTTTKKRVRGTGWTDDSDISSKFRKSPAEEAQARMLKHITRDQDSRNKLLFKTAKSSIDNLKLYNIAQKQYFDSAIETLSAAELDTRLPKLLEKKLGKAFGDIASFADVIRLQRRAESQNLERAINLWNQFLAGGETIENVAKEMEATGYTINDFNVVGKDTTEVFTELRTQTSKLNEGFAKTAHDLNSANFKFEISNTVKTIAGLSVFLGSMYLNAARAAMKHGTTLEIVDAKLLAMSPEELAQLQAENSQAIAASNMTFNDFNTILKDTAYTMFEFTGDLQVAAKLTANSFSMFRSLTLGSADEQRKFITQQEDSFKRFNRILSMTAEEFISMNNQLLQSQSVQGQLFKMDMKRRVLYFQEIQQTVEQLRLNGLTQEQAMGVIEAFEQLGVMAPKERIKQAARIQAVTGAFGLGAEGAEIASIVQRGARGEGDKTRLAELMPIIQTAISETMQGGLASELVAASLIQSTGLENLLGDQSPLTAMVTRQGSKIDEQVVEQRLSTNFLGLQNDKLGKMAADATRIASYTEQIATRGLGEIISQLGNILAAIGAGSIFSGVMAGAARGGVFDHLGKVLKTGVLSKVAIGAGGIGAAAVGGYSFGHLINSGITEGIQFIRKDNEATLGTTLYDIKTSFFDFFNWGESLSDKLSESKAEVQKTANNQQENLTKLFKELTEIQQSGNADQTTRVVGSIDRMMQQMKIQHSDLTDIQRQQLETAKKTLTPRIVSSRTSFRGQGAH